MNRRGLLSLTAAGLIGILAAKNARADEVLRFRVIMHAISVQSQEIGDIDGHAAFLSRFSGLASFPDGTVGTAYSSRQTTT
jgi:hypothetical protein